VIQLSLAELAEAVGGELDRGRPDNVVGNLSTDSRADCSGSVFVPLSGENFDGHDFVSGAVEKGAIGFFWARRNEPPPEGDAAVIRVNDAEEAYRAAAAHNRNRSAARVTGLTGSSGKTSTKSIIANMLYSRRTISTYRNENNEVGVPKTLLRIDENTEFAVIEMGMRARGEIAQLAAAVMPDVAVITNVGVAHIGRLGSEEEIARAKGELLEHVKPGGTTVLNADNKWTPMLSEISPAKVLTFGMKGGDIRSEKESYSLDGVAFRVNARGEKFDVEVPVPGVAGVYNSLAAAAVGILLGIPAEEIARGLALPVEESGRMARVATRNGKVVLDDSYNSNPDSARMALDLLRRVEWDGRKVAVLADMLELGDDSDRRHYEVGRDASGCADVIVTMGPDAAHIARGARDSGAIPSENVFSFEDFEQLAGRSRELFHSGDLVLVKGSRGMKAERVVKLVSEM